MMMWRSLKPASILAAFGHNPAHRVPRTGSAAPRPATEAGVRLKSGEKPTPCQAHKPRK